MLSNYQHVVCDIKLIPSSGGVFEVIVEDKLVFSKKTIKRHAEPGEVLNMFKEIIGPEVPVFEK